MAGTGRPRRATGAQIDAAFSDGAISAADAVAALARLSCAPHLAEVLSATFARYRAADAGRSGRDNADTRCQAAIDCLRALGVEMNAAQRQQFNTNRRAIESRELMDGLTEAGVDYEIASEYVSFQFSMPLPVETPTRRGRPPKVKLRRVVDDPEDEEDAPQT